MNIAGGADILANVAANALVVIGVHVAAHRGILLFDAVDGILRAIDEAIIALHAHATAHAAIGLVMRLFCSGPKKALIEMAKNIVSTDIIFPSPVSRFIIEVAEKQFI